MSTRYHQFFRVVLTVLFISASAYYAVGKAYAAVSPYAARPVPVQVDGTVLDAPACLRQGVTYVPLRSLLEAFGRTPESDFDAQNLHSKTAVQVFAQNQNNYHWEIFWDSEAQCARAVSDAVSLSAHPQTNTIVITFHDQYTDDTNPLVLSAFVSVFEGRTYVPLRILTEALGGTVIWDPYLSGAAVTSPGAAFPAEDLYWLSRIISAESQGETLEGQIAVGNVVLNRVRHPDFPNTIPEVIFDRVDGTQFEPTDNQTIYLTPVPLSIQAARLVLSGVRTIDQELYFYAPALSSGSWINANRVYSVTIGCHKFYL